MWLIHRYKRMQTGSKGQRVTHRQICIQRGSKEHRLTYSYVYRQARRGTVLE